MNPVRQQTLTSSQRVTRMLERRDHDRVPRHEALWPETLERWKREGLAAQTQEDFFRIMESDFHALAWCMPAPFPGQNRVIAEDAQTRTLIDENGNTVRQSKLATTTPEHVAFGCRSADDWFTRYKPALLAQPPKHPVIPDPTASLWAFLDGVEPVTCVHQLVGDETALIAAIEEPDWILDMSRTYTDLLLQGWEYVLAQGVTAHGLWINGDLAYSRGPLFSPQVYRELYWPQHCRMRDWAHQRGMKFIYHTDGDVRMLLPMFIEAGFDCVQPLEAKANMDLRVLAPMYGKQISFFGNIDMMVALTNDRAAVEHEVRGKLAAGMAGRNYAFHSDHSVPPQVSWATYQWIIELVDRYGWY